MDKVVFLVLRRMRAPLVALIVVYAVSTLGLVVIPGVTPDGEVWHMDFFHAFYFVSYTATTIGFGELPYGFSGAQRLWTLLSIYLTVVTWVYAIGKIISLVQDPTFRQVVAERNFTRAVRRINEPFFIIGGYGDTGSRLVRALAERHIRAVVIDLDQERLNDLELEDLAIYVPGMCADASQSMHLEAAGLHSRFCRGVVALTNDDQVNLKIAITTKLLNPELLVICRAENHDVQANMASFGTDHVINPFDTFGEHLALALHSPGTHLLHEWLTGIPNAPLAVPLYPPRGMWVLCGYGRFGKAVHRSLQAEGVETVIVEAEPERTGCADSCVVGRGTEADTLEVAQIRRAVGIVAGTDHDANNLSIMMTARELNPKLFMVARQNKRANDAIFQAARLDLVMQSSDIIAHTIFALVTNPLLSEFLALARERSNEWGNELVSRISAVSDEVTPAVWTVVLERDNTPAVIEALWRTEAVRLDLLLRDPRDRDAALPCVPLLLKRGTATFVLPTPDFSLRSGDRLLFCGRPAAEMAMLWTLRNRNVLRYVQSGENRPDGWVWRWIASRRGSA